MNQPNRTNGGWKSMKFMILVRIQTQCPNISWTSHIRQASLGFGTSAGLEFAWLAGVPDQVLLSVHSMALACTFLPIMCACNRRPLEYHVETSWDVPSPFRKTWSVDTYRFVSTHHTQKQRVCTKLCFFSWKAGSCFWVGWKRPAQVQWHVCRARDTPIGPHKLHLSDLSLLFIIVYRLNWA